MIKFNFDIILKKKINFYIIIVWPWSVKNLEQSCQKMIFQDSLNSPSFKTMIKKSCQKLFFKIRHATKPLLPKLSQKKKKKKKIKGTLCREEIKFKKLNWILEKLEYVILI